MSRHEKIEILFEDKYICVINKPCGLLSVPSASREKSALTILEEIMRKKGTYSPKHKPFAIHRLDRDTSGVMMFALTEIAQKKLMDSWHQIVSERLYRAVAENPKNPHKYLPKAGQIDDDLAFNAYNVGYVPKPNRHADSTRHTEFQSHHTKFQTHHPEFQTHHPEFQTRHPEFISGSHPSHLKTVPARTHYTTILRGKTHTLFELSLDTGKKNQIRAHLASKGYPLAGDKNYRAKTDFFNRLCLHARTLEFTHPFTNQKMKFEVPEPKEWKEYVENGVKVRQSPKSNHRESLHSHI